MKVYHGSYMAIHEIDLIKCEPKRDFGRGFYVTKLRSQAEMFAVRKGRHKHTEAIITEFDFDEEVYEDPDFKIMVFPGYNSDWFDFVIKNRKTRDVAHDYKIIYKIDTISEPVIEQLILDFGYNEEKAADLFYSSATFGKLADISTGLYLNSWQDIYEMLKKELDMT
jgi:hypothetical protein